MHTNNKILFHLIYSVYISLFNGLKTSELNQYKNIKIKHQQSIGKSQMVKAAEYPIDGVLEPLDKGKWDPGTSVRDHWHGGQDRESMTLA